MFGISLPPFMLLPEPVGDAALRMRDIFNGSSNLLRYLKGLGVNYVEIRNINPDFPPEVGLLCAKEIWNAGLFVTVHGALPEKDGDFEQVYGALLPLLAEAKNHQEYVNITVHAYRSDNPAELSDLARRTTETLRRWSKDARRLGFRLSLENDQKHEHTDPGIACADVLSMIKELDPETVGTTFDLGHYYANTLKGEENGPCPPEKFLKRCFHTHIHAYGGRTHLPFTPGNTLPLKEYIRWLSGADYKGVLNLELDYCRFPELDWRESIRDSVRALKAADKASVMKFDRERKALQAWVDTHYGQELSRISRELTDPKNTEDRFYLTTSSGMIFRTTEGIFGIDPAVRSAAARENCAEALKELYSHVPVVFLSHMHVDHFNPETLQILSGLPIRWVVPEYLKPGMWCTGIPEEKITYVKPGDTIALPGVKAEVFEGRHFEPNGNGVDEVQYLFTAGGKRIYLPVDVRDYGLDRFPRVESPDVMVANVWLGRGVSQTPEEWAYEEFCDFVAAFSPKRIYLGHLLEYIREPIDIWAYTHTGIIRDGLTERLPAAPAEDLRLFGKYSL